MLVCQEFERQVTKEMQQVTEYFGEGYDATDPAKVLRVIRDFMMLFDKSIFEIKVNVHAYLDDSKCSLLIPATVPGNRPLNRPFDSAANSPDNSPAHSPAGNMHGSQYTGCS